MLVDYLTIFELVDAEGEPFFRMAFIANRSPESDRVTASTRPSSTRERLASRDELLQKRPQVQSVRIHAEDAVDDARRCQKLAALHPTGRQGADSRGRAREDDRFALCQRECVRRLLHVAVARAARGAAPRVCSLCAVDV